MMLAAFPSSQSNISPQMVEAYVMSVEDFSVEAVEAACRAFIKGGVKGRNNGFAPSAPELSDECQNQQDRILWKAHQESHEFVVEGSDLWRKIEKMQGMSLPVREASIDGVTQRGWDVQKEVVIKSKMIELPKPGSKVVPIPSMKGMG